MTEPTDFHPFVEVLSEGFGRASILVHTSTYGPPIDLARHVTKVEWSMEGSDAAVMKLTVPMAHVDTIRSALKDVTIRVEPQPTEVEQ